MKELLKISKYQLNDVRRSKWIIIYTLFFFAVTYGLINFTKEPSKVLITLLNVILIIIPLVSIIFGTVYLYNNKNNITFLSAQPLKREVLFAGMYIGLVLPLVASFIVGAGLPIIIYIPLFIEYSGILILLLFAGIMLTLIFGCLAFYVSIKNEDKLKGFGLSIFVWLLLSVLYDGLVMFIMYNFSEYPLEETSIALSLLNPIDLARITLILKFDISALMGYTGAVFNNFFGGSWGIYISSVSMLFWIIVPMYFALRNFRKKDF